MVVDRLIGIASPAAALKRAVTLIEQERFAAAFPLLTRAAKAGITDAQYRVARAYLEGAGVPQSQTEGVRWLERAAGQGSVEAQALLAALFLQGVGGTRSADDAPADQLFAADTPAEPDYDSALGWARRAADSGSAEGQALLGYLLSFGPPPMRDLEAAEHVYERSARAGCPQGHLGYALSLARHADTEEERRLVTEELRHAASAGLPTAIYLLGVLAENGAGMERDEAAALAYFKDAAEKGHRSAQVKWGLALIEGRHVAQDLVAGESWLRRAALAGDSRAATLVGKLLCPERPPSPELCGGGDLVPARGGSRRRSRRSRARLALSYRCGRREGR